jgi:hypothetical protein
MYMKFLHFRSFVNLIRITFIPSPLAKFIQQTQIRDLCKGRKRQHQYPEFGHTHGGIERKPPKKYISIQPGWNWGNSSNFDGFLNFTLSFFFPGRPPCCYIDFHCFYLLIIPLEPCALNAEIPLLVLSFSISSYWDLIKFPYFTDTT